MIRLWFINIQCLIGAIYMGIEFFPASWHWVWLTLGNRMLADTTEPKAWGVSIVSVLPFWPPASPWEHALASALIQGNRETLEQTLISVTNLNQPIPSQCTDLSTQLISTDLLKLTGRCMINKWYGSQDVVLVISHCWGNLLFNILCNPFNLFAL